MAAEVINLRDRRPADVREGGWEFDCGICGAHVISFARVDAFPSCLCCRAWCALSRSFERRVAP